MDGVTIIATGSVSTSSIIFATLFFLTAGFLFIGNSIILFSPNKSLEFHEQLLIGFMILVMTVGGLFIIDDANTTASKQYKVLIDDSVSFKEFTNKYDIINVEGEIYTIREKE